MARWWRELAWPEFRVLDPETTVAILPVAAIEQHGPHLPVGVDDFISQGVVEAAMGMMPDGVLVLPTAHVGKSNEHQAYPGTLTLSAETLIRVWTEMGESVARAGVRKLVLVNSHGGQPQVVDIVARDLRVRLGMFVVAANLSGLHGLGGLFGAVEERHGIHGGAAETSEMLYLRPGLVAKGEARDFAPRSIGIEAEYRLLRSEGTGVGFGWQAQDLHPAGACGDASDADAERGRRLVEAKARGLAELVAEVARYPLDHLVERKPLDDLVERKPLSSFVERKALDGLADGPG